MKKTDNNIKGMTLLELLVAVGLSTLILLALYFAYDLAVGYFQIGGDTIQERSYKRILFSKISEDLQLLSRLNRLSENRDELEFEIFSKKVLQLDSTTNDKKILGNVIIYELKFVKDFYDEEYKALIKTVQEYEWWQRFGHTLQPYDDIDPPGYPSDIFDAVYGRQDLPLGDPVELLEQEEKKEFLLQSIQFIPYDDIGNPILTGESYDELKGTRSFRVLIEYKIKGRYGSLLQNRVVTKQASHMVNFINYIKSTTSTSAGLVSPAGKFLISSWLVRNSYIN
jgi:hypothetical protein